MFAGFWVEVKFSAPLDKYQGAGLLDHMVGACLVLGETPKLSPTVAAPFALPSAVTQAPAPPHPPQHLVLSAFSILAILIGVWLYIVLICNPLITENVDHLFTCLLLPVYFL